MEKVLVVTSYGDLDEEFRVTINPLNVSYVQATSRLVLHGNKNLHKVYVKFCEEGSMEIYIDGYDLKILETGVGTYGYDD